MAFRSLSRSSATKYLTAITNFAGVDYSSQRFKVASNHAIDILNFIYKDGVIQKRNGYEELFELTPTPYLVYEFSEPQIEYNGQNIDANPISGTSDLAYKVNTLTFNGLWSVKGEDKKTHIIAHIGRLIYEIKDIDKPTREIVPLFSTKQAVYYEGEIYKYAYEFLDQKSMGFVGANRFYFLGGNKFMCLRFINGGYTFYPVEDHDETYIPTTTMSITYKNSYVAGRESLDKVNLMTMRRKNELLSGTLKNEDEKTQTDFYDYTLDAPIITDIDDEDNAIVEESKMSDFRITLTERGTIE